MKKSKTKLVTIRPRTWYTMQDILRGKMFPRSNSIYKVKYLVQIDQEKSNILNPVITGTCPKCGYEGRATKYRFLGKNIIKFAKLIESGKIRA